MMTAAQAIQQAISENSKIFFDHETKRFAAFTFTLEGFPNKTTVRVHKDSNEYKILSEMV